MRRNGFNLVEMALATMLSGILLCAVLPVYQAWMTRQYLQVTRARMADINTSISNFVTVWGFLPCPASYTLTDTTATDCTAAPVAGTFSTGGVRIGAVPIKTLNDSAYLVNNCTASGGTLAGSTYASPACTIPAPTPTPLAYSTQQLTLLGEERADYLNNQFTYAVTEAETVLPSPTYAPLITVTVPTIDNSQGAITVTDGTNIIDAPLPNSPPNGALYVLIAHGKDGSGAYPLGATAALPCGTGYDAANCIAPTATFVAASYSEASSGTHFDDYINYVNYMVPTCPSGLLFNGVKCAPPIGTVADSYVVNWDSDYLNPSTPPPPSPDLIDSTCRVGATYYLPARTCQCPPMTTPVEIGEFHNLTCYQNWGADLARTINCGWDRYECIY